MTSRRIVPSFALRVEDGAELSTSWWQPAEPWRAVSSALVGGGIGSLHWFLNAQVIADYGRMDPAGHVSALAHAAGLAGPGVGMLTAVDVRTVEHTEEDGVEVLATVGLGWPTWAAAPAPPTATPEPSPATDIPAAIPTEIPTGIPTVGTINLLVVVPGFVVDGALVNLLATATEAKAQALFEADVQGTGTASDAVCVAVAPTRRDPDAPLDHTEQFGGPRSYWGQRVARAVHRAVRNGAAADWDRAVRNGWPRPPRQGG